MNIAKPVLNKEEADKVAIAYAPRKFPMTIAPVAQTFHSLQVENPGASFQLDRIVAKQTGVDELERVTLEEKVELEALARLKEVQEQAYQQAYQLGLDEGREKAFQENQALLTEKLESLNALLHKIESLKTELVTCNEAHVMQLIYHLASKLAMTEISSQKELVLEVLKAAVGDTQAEEKITVKLSAEDLQFVEQSREKLSREAEVFRNMKLEEGPHITSGGCIIETNYGVVDATVEKRVQKLWNAISDKLPKVKDVVGS